jgi:hypothetical protein
MFVANEIVRDIVKGFIAKLISLGIGGLGFFDRPHLIVTYIYLTNAMSLFILAQGLVFRFFHFDHELSPLFVKLSIGIFMVFPYFLHFYKKDRLYYMNYETTMIYKYTSKFIVALVMVISIFYGPVLRVLLFGGNVFGKPIVGLLN